MRIQKRAVKGLIAFLAAMAALTLFARTLHYGLLPKVEAREPGGGVLKALISSDELILSSNRAERLSVPVNLEAYPLWIDRVWAAKHDVIAEGDPLVQFDPALAKDALRRAERALQRAQEALQAWDQKFERARNELADGIAALQKKSTDPKADAQAQKRQSQALQREQATLERAKMLEGVSRASLEQSHSELKSICDALSALDRQDWILRCEGGILDEVLAKPGESYAGLRPLARLIPSGANLRVGIAAQSGTIVPTPEQVIVYAGDSPPRGESDWRYMGSTPQGDRLMLWAEPLTEEMPDLSALERLTFQLESEYLSCLVPNSAVIGGTHVYVLESRFGAWGAEEYCARRVEVRGLQSDDRMTSIATGLTGMERVITRWDRPFGDGDAVALPLS